MSQTQPTESPAGAGALDFAELQKLAAEILGVDPERVQPEVSFARDLAADSLDLVELIMAIEDRYQVALPEELLNQMKRVGQLWDYLLIHASAP
ncbi:MAG: acyl carrier protein [Candidatus Dormibacteria bacterium]